MQGEDIRRLWKLTNIIISTYVRPEDYLDIDYKLWVLISLPGPMISFRSKKNWYLERLSVKPAIFIIADVL